PPQKFVHKVTQRIAKVFSSGIFVRLRGGNSFASKSDHRVNLRRPSRRNPTSQQSDQDKQRCYDEEGQRIGGIHAVEQPFNQSRQSKSRQQSKQNAHERQLHSLHDDQPERIARLCAQRHADADFVRTARDGKRDDAVQTNAGQQYSQRAEDAGERRRQTVLRQNVTKLLFDGVDAQHGQVGINFTQFLSDSGGHLEGV